MVRFDKRERYWLGEDRLSGSGEHDLAFRFHLAPGLETTMLPDGSMEVCDKMNGARLMIVASGTSVQAELEERFSSRDYGAKQPSVSICWAVRSSVPLTARFALVPVGANEDERERLRLIQQLAKLSDEL